MPVFFSQFSSAREIGSDTVYILHTVCFFLKFSRLGKKKGGTEGTQQDEDGFGSDPTRSILTKVGEGRTGDPANQLCLIVGGYITD